MERRIDNLGEMIPFMLSLGCARAWLTLLFADPSFASLDLSFDPHVVFDYGYALVGIAIAFAARRIAPLQEARWSKPVAVVAATLASSSMMAAFLAPAAAAPLSAVGGVLGGVAFLLMTLLNAEALVSRSLVRILLYQAAGKFIGVPLAYLCSGLDLPRFALVVFVLPVVSVACSRLAYRQTPAAERQPKVWPRFSFPWKPVALFAVYSFAYGLHEPNLAAGAGIHSSLSTAVISAALFLVVYFFSDRLPLTAVFRSPLPLMVCGFLLIPSEAVFGSAAASYLISMSNTLMELLMGLLLYDLSKRMGIAIIVLLGVEKVAYLFRVWGGECAALLGQTGLSAQEQNAIIVVAVVLLVLAGTMLLYSEKDINARWGMRLFETGALSEESRRAEMVNARCDEIVRQCRLTPREDEILRLLARGKSNAAIEHELLIASGTLKAHIQHIYVKTDVHSRKDLAALFADADEGAGVGERPSAS